MASVLVLQCCDQLNYEDPYIRSRPVCWVHLNPWKEWNIKLQLPLRRSYLHIKFVFPLFTSSFCVSFLSRVKMNSTNWPAPNIWVLIIAQIVKAMQKWSYISGAKRLILSIPGRIIFLGKTRTKPHEVYQPRSLGVAQALFTTLAGPMTGTFKSTLFLAFIIIIFYYTCIIYRSIAACAWILSMSPTARPT